MFKNEPLTDFSIESNRTAFKDALDKLSDTIQSGKLSASPLINGSAVEGETTYESIDPASPHTVIGKVSFANKATAERALQSLKANAAKWADTPFDSRSKIIRNVAAVLRAKRHQISALMVREAGKTWAEADADTCEAIDFCEYYASQMLQMGPPRKLGDVKGEENTYFYEPRGVCVVIAPWNFPCAIATGMVSAALVTGNVVAFKPSEQTSLVGKAVVDAFLEAGCPPYALSYLPGWGEEIGAYMVESPLVDMICFTGSKDVGLEIIRKASEVKPGQRNVKKVVAEMGGKNAAIVDEDADLDEAIKGVLLSAFGFAGQKCSACSRVICVGDIYEPFLKRLISATEDIIVGRPSDPSTFLGPVIDKESYDRLMDSIRTAEAELELAFKGKTPAEEGYYIPATIFRDVERDHWVWKKELFGPVVACRSAQSFSEAIDLALDSEYALTGGVYSRSPANIEKAIKEFKVGNLYINRKQTGALVYRQPFGGARMSGIGSKAGGPDYLIQFVEPRTVTENTIRKGFVPS
ncbi:MAG: L-glutamate gamma-semialdehyde dehydrogenase [Candidatus Dadabacteria bacterium]|nr:MAG: L-glutamate gamma-semialdehyde dehydrogenase [Candidatus Dadabacteria bacterium]